MPSRRDPASPATLGRFMSIAEAWLDDSGSGLAPAGDGWFVVNVRDAEWVTSETFGAGVRVPSRSSLSRSSASTSSVTRPGRPNCLYHSESQQEAFLVLSGSAGCSWMTGASSQPE